jgi:hypothetical protein
MYAVKNQLPLDAIRFAMDGNRISKNQKILEILRTWYEDEGDDIQSIDIPTIDCVVEQTGGK